jgi:hypothetical protein
MCSSGGRDKCKVAIGPIQRLADPSAGNTLHPSYLIRSFAMQ